MILKETILISAVPVRISLGYFESPLVRLFASSPAVLGFTRLQMVLQSNVEQGATDIKFGCPAAVLIMVMEAVVVQLFSECRAARVGRTL